MKNVPNAVILLIGVLAVVRAAKKAEEEKFESKRVKRQAEKGSPKFSGVSRSFLGAINGDDN